MPPLSLTNKHIELACEMREYGGSNGACARHAGVANQTFFTWLHYGEIVRDYLDNDNVLPDISNYRTWASSAEVMLAKVQRELDANGGKLSKEHKRYLKLWDEMQAATDVYVSECQQTVDRHKKLDPELALRELERFHPGEYTKPPERLELTGKDGGKLKIEYVNDWRGTSED
jgi:hypothetical protein